MKKENTSALASIQGGSGQEILSSDIILPRLLLMQGLSELVSARKAQQGDFVRSTTSEKLGDPESPVQFIPLKMTSDWVNFERLNGKWEFRGMESRNAKNEDLPWEYKQNGADWKRMKTLNVFALLPADIAAYQKEIKAAAEKGEIPDLDKTLLPVVLTFRSTSFNAGKGVATLFAKVQDMQQHNPQVRPYHYSLTLSAAQETNDKGTYYVFTVGKTNKVDMALVKEAARWYEILTKTSNVRIDADDTGDVQTDAKAAQAANAHRKKEAQSF